jgi:hypothetical protein
MFLILTMIVLVAALNIVSGLIMLVKDKGQDIAILRTMGASQGSIIGGQASRLRPAFCVLAARLSRPLQSGIYSFA